jgi:cell division protein FtsW
MLGQRLRQAFRLDEIEGRIDPALLAAAVALAALGLVMVASASVAIADGFGVGTWYFLSRHAVFLLLGTGLALALCRVELKHIEAHSRLLLLLCFLLLAAVFLPVVGKTVNGARRWLDLGVSSFQAVEAVKLLLVVWLASYLVRYREALQNTWFGALKPMGIAGGLVLLLLAQPDFGSALLLLAITGGMLWTGGVRLRYLALPAFAALPAIVLVAMSESYRLRRLTSFLDPWADPFKDGFQLTQALIAVGRGEWFGVGLGASVQKLFYLPEAHTDFIFAVLAEELGFVGVLAVLALYALLVGRAFQIGLRAVDIGRHFAANCAFGVGLWIALQAFVSIGVNLGLLPTKGLTLPLVSSGGSSVLMTCAAIGLLLRVSYETDRAVRQVARLRGEPLIDPEGLLTGEARPAPGRRSEPVWRDAA